MLLWKLTVWKMFYRLKFEKKFYLCRVVDRDDRKRRCENCFLFLIDSKNESLKLIIMDVLLSESLINASFLSSEIGETLKRGGTESRCRVSNN